MYRLNNISGKYYQNITGQELVRSKKDCIVLKGTVSFNEMLYQVLQFKAEVEIFFKIFN